MTQCTEINKVKLSEIARVINKHKNFIILTHFSADGDAIGSSFAMSLALQELNKKACVVLEEEIPRMYSFLPSGEVFCIKNKLTKVAFDEYVVIAIDSGDVSRFGKRKGLFDNADITINLDHHYTNDDYGNYNYVDSTYSSSGEIVFELIKELKVKIDESIAICIYVAILTDTGGFKHASTNSRTHRIAAELLENDLDTSSIAMQVFDKTSKAKLMLVSKALASLEFFLDSKAAVMTLTQKDFEESKADDEETEGLVEFARNIENVEIAILIKEVKENSYRVNLRSNTDLDVSKIAALFNGGGHKKAAGCNFKGDYILNRNKIISEISKRI